MKKRGYTLAEVLITLGIIGIIAALALPLANKYKPDATKVMYIKTYDSIVEAVSSMAKDSKLYPIIGNGYNYNDAPFYNTTAVTLQDGTSVGGSNSKFCQTLAQYFNSASSCSAEWKAYSDKEFRTDFIAKNGVAFMINTKTNPSYQTDIYFDINGIGNGSDCIFNKTECKNPDRFKLIVGAGGSLIAADPVGAEYLETRSNWKKKEADINGEILANLPSDFPNPLPSILPEDDNNNPPGGDDETPDDGDKTPEEPTPPPPGPPIVYTYTWDTVVYCPDPNNWYGGRVAHNPGYINSCPIGTNQSCPDGWLRVSNGSCMAELNGNNIKCPNGGMPVHSSHGPDGPIEGESHYHGYYIACQHN